MYEYGGPDSGQYVNPLGTIAEYGMMATPPKPRTRIATRAGRGCCDGGSIPDDCCTGGRSIMGRIGGTALGLTSGTTVIALPAFTTTAVPGQLPPGMSMPSSSSNLMPILLLGGLAVGGFFIIRKLRARAAAPTSNPRRRRRR